MKKIVLYGAGGHCISLINLIERTKKFKIIGIIGKKKELNKNILNYKVNYTDGDLISLQKKCKFLALSITNYLNLKKRDLLIKKNKDPSIWMQLSEIQRAGKNIVGYHLSKGEYYLLIGDFQNALNQFQFAFARDQA